LLLLLLLLLLLALHADDCVFVLVAMTWGLHL
jgi:hypothetical protein